MLGTTEVRWKVDIKISIFKCLFVDYVNKGYSGKEHVQVAAVIQLAVKKVQYHQHAANNIIIQSENDSDLESQELTPFILI